MREKIVEMRENSRSQDVLKKDLVEGRLSPEQFLSRVLNLDQEDADRRQANKNIELLENPEVAAILAVDEDVSREYFNLLSLSYFHVGQEKLFENDSDAQYYVRRALDAAERSYNSEADLDWRRYITAAIAYTEKDVEHLKRLASQMDESKNKNIVLNMIAGLEKFGGVDYSRDYRND